MRSKLCLVWCGPQESFTVTTSDEFGNPSMDSTAHVTFKATSINRAPAPSAASAAGPAAVAVAASFGGQCSPSVERSDQEGAYVCSFITMKAAWYNVSVFIGSAELNGSPFLVEVLPDRSRAARSVATGAGLSFAESGVDASFHIKTRDRFGNDCVDGGDKVQVRIVGARHVEATVSDANNGTYVAHYATSKAGAYSVSVLVNEQILPGSPFKLQVPRCCPSSASSLFARRSRLLRTVPMGPDRSGAGRRSDRSVAWSRSRQRPKPRATTVR